MTADALLWQAIICGDWSQRSEWPAPAAAIGLPAYEKRCQGRTVRVMGSAVLASECTDCARRTDIPPGVDLQWMEAPRSGPCFFKRVNLFSQGGDE